VDTQKKLKMAHAKKIREQNQQNAEKAQRVKKNTSEDQF
jgi:hypothetical protein